MAGETPNNFTRVVAVAATIASLAGAVAGAFGWAFIAGGRYERMTVRIEILEREMVTKDWMRDKLDTNAKTNQQAAVDAVMLKLSKIYFHCDAFPTRGRGWFRCEISRNEE